jgi:ubiquinone/menaquinone biosynthesis C-methylase UbiE
MSKAIFKKTRNVYLGQHKVFFKHNDLFDRFYDYAVNPKNYCLSKNFFKGANVLDAGCGNTGYFAKAMLDLGAKHVHCMDLGNKWKSALKKGLKNKGVPLSKISFVSGSVTNIPFKSETFNFTACNGVLYHLPNKRSSSKALKELFRVTKNKGSIFVYLGVEKPGLIDKYILPSLRKAYLKEKNFKKLIDNGNLDIWKKNLKNLADIFYKKDNFFPLNSIKKFLKLINLETLMFMQDCLQVPINQSEKLDKKYSLKILKKIGAKNIRIPNDHYFKRTDIRRFLTPLHVTKKTNLLSKMLYGENLKFTFDKINK